MPFPRNAPANGGPTGFYWRDLYWSLASKSRARHVCLHCGTLIRVGQPAWRPRIGSNKREWRLCNPCGLARCGY